MIGGARALSWVERAAALLVGAFLVWYLVGNWRQVSGYEWTVDAGRLAAATACLVAAYSGFVLAWRRLLAAFGARLSVTDAHRVWYLGNLGRYVPGKVLQLAGTAWLAAGKGASPVVTITASVVAQLFVLAAGVVVAAVALPEAAGARAPVLQPMGIAVAAVFVLVVLTPLFGVLHRLAFRLVRRPELHAAVPLRERGLVLGLTTVCMALFGLAFALFVTGVTTVERDALLPLAGICAAGYLAGYVAVFVPGGLGVREGVYALLLAVYIPASIAVAVAILARLWLTLVELAAVAYLVARYGTSDLRSGAPSAHG